MQKALLGKKVGMTQVYDEGGHIQPVTVVQAGPCAVLQVKTPDTDGYWAVQIGFDDLKPHRARRPQIGHAKKAGSGPKRFVREVRLAAAPEGDVTPGQILTVDVFEGVKFLDITGTSKGKGFAGVMKRYRFGGQPATHGTERKHRSPGSIGSHACDRGFSGKPKRGKKMSGHMGDVRRTVRNHVLVGIDKENNLLLIRGDVPGASGGFVFVKKSKTAKAQ